MIKSGIYLAVSILGSCFWINSAYKNSRIDSRISHELSLRAMEIREDIKDSYRQSLIGGLIFMAGTLGSLHSIEEAVRHYRKVERSLED